MLLSHVWRGPSTNDFLNFCPFGTSIADSREKKKEKCQKMGLTNLGEGVYT